MEDETNEIAQEEAEVSGKEDAGGPEDTKDFSGRVAGGLIGFAIGLFVASSMTLLTSLWGVWLWGIVAFAILLIGVRLGRFLPDVSRLTIFLLIILCVVATLWPIFIQHVRLTRIVDQLSDFSSAELQEIRLSLFATHDYPGFSARFTTDAEVREVVEFYRKSLSEAGWSVLGDAVDEKRSLAAAEYDLRGRYRLILRMKDDQIRFVLFVLNFNRRLPAHDLVLELEYIR